MLLTSNRWLCLALVTLVSGSLVGCKTMPFFGRASASKVETPQDSLAKSVDDASKSTSKGELNHSIAPIRSKNVASKAGEPRLPVDFDPVREVITQRSPAPANFAPCAMNPLSPVSKANRNQVPPAYEKRLEELNLIGKQLAIASDGAPLSFDVLYNPKRVATCHSASGDIYVTSAMLEKLESRHQLAVAVAMEMAKYLNERKIAEEARSRQIAGIPENATLNGEDPLKRDANPSLEESASAILAKAGFDQIDFEKVKSDVDVLIANNEHSSPTRNMSKVPMTLKPVAAN